MDKNFEKYSKQLTDALEGKLSDSNLEQYKGYTYFVKGDISGIQEFIFNVKSRGAAKTLKGKSLYVQATSELCLAYAEKFFGKENIKLLYNGGGDFYFFLKNADDEKRKEFRTKVLQSMLPKEIYIDITYEPINDDNLTDFGKKWTAINQASITNQMRQYQGFKTTDLFQPFDFEKMKETLDWKEFTTRYNKKEKAIISSTITPEHEPQLFDLQYHFTGAWSDSNSKLPTWTDDLLNKYVSVIDDKEEDANYNNDNDWQKPDEGKLIEFDYLARFAAARCGTSKLGILKMDIDNLGNFFDKRQNINELKICSESMAWFFEDYLINDLLKKEFKFLEVVLDEKGKPKEKKVKNDKGKEIKHYEVKTIKCQFFENIYVIFSGGDDCFLLGAWDAVFAFAKLVYSEFSNFTKQNIEITLSASLVLVDAKFPVVQFAKLANRALDQAKAKPNKHSIAIMGEVFSWEDFEKIEAIALDLQRIIIEKREPRGILEKIRLSARGFLGIQKRINEHQLNAPKIWRLLWYLRGSKNKEEIENIFQKYYIKPLLTAYVSKQSNNAMLFPIAARWAEFLTRKK